MRAEVAKPRAGPGSPLSFLFVAVFVDMIGYGIVAPLLPFYAREHASGAVLVGLLGSLYADARPRARCGRITLDGGGPDGDGAVCGYALEIVGLRLTLAGISVCYLAVGLLSFLTPALRELYKPRG